MNDVKIAPDAAPAAVPFRVRLEPYLIESICELARVIRDKGTTQTDVSGLLFGAAENSSRVIAALKPFEDAGPRSDLVRRERLEKAYVAAVEAAQDDPELSSMNLVGWFSFRNGSGLLSSDVVFHNQHFRKPEDLAMVVWREGAAQITAEVYSKSGITPMTSTEYRWSSVRLSSEIRHMSEPIDLAMRVKLSDDSFLRAYEADEPETKLESWKKRAGGLLSFLQFRPKEDVFPNRVRGLIEEGRLPAQPNWSPRPMAGNVPENQPTPDPWRRAEFATPSRVTPESDSNRPVAAAAAAAGAAPGAAKMPGLQRVPDLRPASNLPPVPVLDLGRIGQTPQRSRTNVRTEVSGLPMVIRPTRPKKQFPWLWAAAIFVLCSGVVFAVLALGGLQGGSGRLGQMVSSLFPGGDLNLRVRSEDDRLRLSWNSRNAAVASATDGTLQILDGPQRRDIHLEGRQVADGSVLYRPITNDVTFRLEVHGNQGSTMGSVRVLDGPQGRTPALDVSDPLAPAQSSSQTVSQLPAQSPVEDPYPSSTPSTTTLKRDAAGTQSTPLPSIAGSPAETSSRGVQTPLVPATTLLTPDLSSTAPYRSRYDASKPVGTAGTASTLPAPNTRTPGLPGTSTINGWESIPEPSSRRKKSGTSAGTADFVAPQPLLQVTPNTKALAGGAVQTTTRVEVQVRVDHAGHVAYARVLNGGSVSRTVVDAALNAARQWTFQPATLRGQAVESDHTIVFEFRPQR